jgi:hypothetical protein
MKQNSSSDSVTLIISPPFTEPKGSLQFSQEPATGPYPESQESNPQIHILFL